MIPDLSPIFSRYESLRAEADALFARVRETQPGCVTCKEGCSDCCHAVFDLSLVEAMSLNRAFEAAFAHGPERSAILTRASETDRRLTRLRVGITHTAESNLITEVLAKFGRENDGVSITITTDTIKNLYDAMEHFELDLAVVDSTVPSPDLNALMLDTDCIVCVLSNNNPLSRHAMVTLEDLKKERMILRLPSSATRKLFEAHLLSLGMSIDAFDVAMEVDNIATIKDLIRKDLGVSILARSACMDELRKGKLTALPIENLSMVRQMNLVYRKDFQHMELLYEILRLYHDTAMQLQ